MPSVTARFSGADYYGGMTASLFTGESLGYLLVGLLAFALGVCVTVLCVRLHERERDEGSEEGAAMLELWDYLVQFLVTAYGFCAALREYYRARRRPWFLLTCFYATFALGTLYWSLHLLLRQETPQVFYVSDLAWLASFATFENVCYLTQNGAGQFVYLLIRGFGTGAMHIVCGSVYGRVLRPVWGSCRSARRVCSACSASPSSTTPSIICS